MYAPWEPRPHERAAWFAHGVPDLTWEVNAMADEGYKLQISTKIGDSMVNLRADDEGELAMLVQNLEESDAPISRAIYELVADEFDLEPKSKPKSRSRAKAEPDDEDEDEPDDEDEDEEDEKPKPRRRRAPASRGGSTRKTTTRRTSTRRRS